MKLKKFFIVVIAVCMLSISQSAYAHTGNDTREDAFSYMYAPFLVESHLTSTSDVDWYRWINNTGVTKDVKVIVGSVYAGSEFNLFVEYVTLGGAVINLGYAFPSSGSTTKIMDIRVAPNDSIRYRVEYANGVGPTKPYLNHVFTFDI